MTKTIPFASYPQDFVPVLSELPNILLEDAQFMCSKNLTEDSLPVGAVCCILDQSGRLKIATYLGKGFYPNTLAFTNANTLCTDEEDAEDNFSCSYYRLDKNFYIKVLFQLPVYDEKPQFDNLEKIIKDAGGFSLANATPDMLPQGALVLLTHLPSQNVKPVICRVLLEGKRFLMFVPDDYIPGNWIPNWVNGESSYKFNQFMVLPI